MTSGEQLRTMKRCSDCDRAKFKPDQIAVTAPRGGGKEAVFSSLGIAKRYLVHFWLKMLLAKAILRAHSRKVCLSLVCLQATMHYHLVRHK